MEYVRIEWEHMFVRAKLDEQRRARELRAQDWALRRIAAELDVALSSVSVWARGIPRPDSRRMHVVQLRLLSGAIQRCGKCRRLLPVELFNRHPTKDRQHWCRECFRAYFRARGALHRRQVRVSRQRRTQLARDHVVKQLLRAACTDCGESDLVVLDYDHVRGEKVGDISRLINEGVRPRILDQEIAKCEVCANCHRRRTAEGADNWRSRWMRKETIRNAERPGWSRNLNHVGAFLELRGCMDCAVSDIRVLEFDHVIGAKSFSISAGIRGEVPLHSLIAEMSKCDIRCSNCHRRRTAERAGFYRHRIANS